MLIPIALLGCAHNQAAQGRTTASTRESHLPNSPTTQLPLFEDVAARAGVKFTHTSGASGQFRFIEFSPAGCAFVDYDNDGFLDILLIQSGPSEPRDKVTGWQGDRVINNQHSTPNTHPSCALYHNNGDGTFADVTAGSGLDCDLGYAQGVAVGDYDNDGFDDLFITSYGGNHLFHNRGSGFRVQGSGNASPNPEPRTLNPLFEDVTHKMGLDTVHSTGYATSAAFGDYDNDGRLDLYVCYYAPWTAAMDRPCLNEEKLRDYCSPELFPPDTHRLYHNDGDRFTDVSEKAGITKLRGRGLAVAFLDYDGDGRQDIFVANDLSPNMLWHNEGAGRFTDVAAKAGVAYAEGGATMAGMGIAVADYDRSGRESLFVTNFSGMPNTLFKNTGGGLFQNVGSVSGLGPASMKFLAFGCEFLDYDADGRPDLLVANGSVYLHADTRLDGATYKERKQLFHNEGHGAFREIADKALLGDLAVETVSRGLAVGDFDNDGRLDALVNNQNGHAQLFHNLDRSANHWVSFKTIGVRSNRDGYHARFTLTAGGVTQTATVRAGSSYLSHSDTRVYFGLGPATRIDRVEIRWPSGTKDVLKDVSPGAIYVVTEGRGINRRGAASSWSSSSNSAR